MVDLEKQLEVDQQLQAGLAAKSAAEQQELVQYLAHVRSFYAWHLCSIYVHVSYT